MLAGLIVALCPSLAAGECAMSMQPGPWPEPAEEITRAVRAIYGGRREVPLPVQVRDQLGEVFCDGEFAEAFGTRGRPGWSPGRLALVTVLQMAEDLTDRQAADAVRLRIDWKYALGLGLAEPGVDASVLCEFRARVLAHGLEERALDLLLAALKDKGLVAAAAPRWTAEVIDVAGWSRRYGPRVDTWRLPSSKAKRAELAVAYGRDGFALLTAVYGPAAPGWLRELAAVEVLRMVLMQNYTRSVDRSGREVVKRREADTDGLPPGRLRVTSPYDVDARWAAKGEDLVWNGFKVHLTETCDAGDAADGDGGRADGPPNLVTNVTTTDATVPDAKMTTAIHDRLAARGLLPGEHYVDSGYPSAAGIVDARRSYGIALVSPLLADQSPQAKAGGGYDRASFAIDFDAAQAVCPQGKTSSWWVPATQRGREVIVVKFAAATCRACPARDQCTRSASSKFGRQLTVPPREVHDAQRAARTAQAATDWQARYAIRAGVEGTIRQGIAVCGMRRARYRGLPRPTWNTCSPRSRS